MFGDLGLCFVFSLCVVCAHSELTNIYYARHFRGIILFNPDNNVRIIKYALYYCSPHFTDKESEVWRNYATIHEDGEAEEQVLNLRLETLLSAPPHCLLSLSSLNTA